jgi:chaperonin GroES
MKIRPLGDRILVEREAAEEKTAGGIYIPESGKEKPQRGKVVAVGVGKRDDQGNVHAVDVKVGDTVVFGKYAGTEVTVESDEYVVMREDDIIGVIE